MSHSQPDLDRYHRQTLLPGFGEEGQQRVRAARVLIVGCGALGSLAGELLVRAGVGSLVIADRDFVEWTNLQRQVLFDESDAAGALPKAEAARQKLAAINSDVRIEAAIDDVNETNIEHLAAGCDAIVDGTDNYATRFLINDVAVKQGIPYVYGGAVGTTGMQYTVLPRTSGGDAAWELAGRATPCLRCVFEQAPPPGTSPTCETVGVLNAVVGIVASFEAAAALKVLTGQWSAIEPGLLHVDPWHNAIRELDAGATQGEEDCICCGQRCFEYLAGRDANRGVTLCGRDAVQLRANGRAAKLDLEQLAARLGAHGEVRVNPFMLRAAIREGEQAYELTVFADGRAIVKGTQQPATARSLYARYVGT